MNSLFASTARGLEELLKTELENLGAVECQVVQGGVHFKGDTRLVYQSLMWSRLASRIMLPLGECKVYSDLDLYLGVQAINWTEMFNPGATFAVHFSGLNDTIRNSQYGSGTLLIEAAMLATDRAPGLHRGRWGFSGWAQHDEAIWQEVKAEAQTRARKGLAEYSSHFYGSDSDARVIQRARTNARLAGIGELITFEVKDVAQLTNPLPKGPYGTVLSNPPYGERLDSEPALIALHSLLGRIMKNQFGGWNLSLFSASPDLLSCLQLRADKQYKAKNGPLDCVQKNYHVAESTTDSKPAMVAEEGSPGRD